VVSTANPFQWQLEEGIRVNYWGRMKKVSTIRVLDTSSFCRQLLLSKQVMSVATNLPLLPERDGDGRRH
jgi:hypothetical protein